MPAPIAIIGGTGALGFGLAQRWERAGVPVVLGLGHPDQAPEVGFEVRSNGAAAVSGKATRTLGVWQGSAAQQAAEMAPEGVRVVAALHTVSAARLRDPEHPLDEDVLVCGDDPEAKREAIALIERIDGLRGVDAGGLEQARFAEHLKALLIGIDAHYRTQTGVRIVGLP